MNKNFTINSQGEGIDFNVSVEQQEVIISSWISGVKSSMEAAVRRGWSAERIFNKEYKYQSLLNGLSGEGALAVSRWIRRKDEDAKKALESVVKNLVSYDPYYACGIRLEVVVRPRKLDHLTFDDLYPRQ